MNIFKKSVSNWNVEKLTGYRPITTFWHDFSLADNRGADAILKVYTKVFNEWKTNYRYITELVLVLYYKIWQYNGKDNILINLYYKLWNKTSIWCEDNFSELERKYYIETTD